MKRSIHFTFSFFLKKVDKSPYLNVKCKLYGTSLDKLSWETDILMSLHATDDGRKVMAMTQMTQGIR